MRLLFDLTSTLHNADKPPVGTTRLEQIVLADFLDWLGREKIVFLNHDLGRFVPVSTREADRLIEIVEQQRSGSSGRGDAPIPPAVSDGERRDFAVEGSFAMRSGFIRRFPALRCLGRLYLRAFDPSARVTAAQGAWEIYSGAIQTFRAMRRTLGTIVRRRDRRALLPATSPSAFPALSVDTQPLVDTDWATDLLIMGNGWDYLDYQRLDALRRCGIRIHGFVHDLIAVDRPHLFHDPKRASAVHQHYAELCNVCTTLVCNSYATRSALLKFIQEESLPTPEIKVAQLPSFDGAATTRPVALDAELPDRGFILFVSTIEVRKNHQLLLKIWRECQAEGRSLPILVFVGHRGWGTDIVFHTVDADPLLAGRVRILHDLKDGELLWLYDRCLFSVYPSQAEGWGLPICESLGRGRVCIHALDAAQKEAAQGLMPAVHPEDFLGWKAAILDLVERPQRRLRLEQAIRERFRAIGKADFCATMRSAVASADGAMP